MQGLQSWKMTPTGPFSKGGAGLCESKYRPPTSRTSLPNRFQQHLQVSYHEPLPENLLAERSIWSSKAGEREGLRAEIPRGVCVFCLGNGYPVKTDAFMPSSFNGREEAAGEAGQRHGAAGPRRRAAPAPAACGLPGASLPQALAEWRSCS